MTNFFIRTDSFAINLDKVVSIDFERGGDLPSTAEAAVLMCNGRTFHVLGEDVGRLRVAVAPVKAKTRTMTETVELTLDDPTRKLMEDLGWIRK